MDKDPRDIPNPAIFEAIKKRNNLAAYTRTKAILNSHETKRNQKVNRGMGTVTVELERTITPETKPSLHAAGYAVVGFSRTYEYDHTGEIQLDALAIEATNAADNAMETYMIINFGKDDEGEDIIMVGVEDLDRQESRGFSESEKGNITGDIEDYDRSEPDGFIDTLRDVTAQERVHLEAILNACEAEH